MLYRINPAMMSDRLRLEMKYLYRMHDHLDLDHPVTFNEKLQWLKLYDRNPKYTMMVDKYLVKDYISQTLGEGHVIPTLAVYQSADEIDFDALPNQFVMKCTHDSGGSYLCKDKSTFDFEKVKSILTKNLRTNNYNVAREWPYKNVPHRIIIDRLLDDHTGDVLRDYKFWCFNGVPTYMYCTVKDKKIYENFYDMDFKPVDINHGFERTVPEYVKPNNFERMIELATVLSKDIPFVRIDFFNVNGRLYFGECTFYDWAGLRPFVNEEWDYKLGSLIDLSMLL